jgi:hypothetical protein
MKFKFIFALLLVSVIGFAQDINSFKAVIIPLKYDFLKSDNQYRLATLTKINLQKAGFVAFYSNEDIPSEYKDRCSLLAVDVKKESGFLITKLIVVLNDCFGKLVYQSEIGKSKEKEFEKSYSEALNAAFQSIYKLNYKYNNQAIANTNREIQPEAISVVQTKVVSNEINKENLDLNVLYAQATPTGYQLVDSSPKVVFKLNKTSLPTLYTATKGTIQGVLIQKENQWFFEYYENANLVSEKVTVKF